MPFPKPLWFILAVALGVRLLGAWNGNLMYDEANVLTSAETIDLRPRYFNFVTQSVDHPPLSVYVVRLSAYLFGDSNFGLRILHVLFGTLTVIPVFFLGKKIFSEQAGLWAAALLAVDQFHQTWSHFILPEILLLFFVSLVLLQFLRVLESKARGDFLRLGLLLGFAYLAKETAIVLILALWLCVLVDPKLRPLIRNPMWYLAHGVALLVVSPDILWNLFHYYEGYFYRDATFLSRTEYALAPRSVLLFLGEILEHFTRFRIGHPSQTPSVSHWPAGLLYIGAIIVAWRARRQSPVRLLIITFLFVFLFYTFLPAPRIVGWWWASVTLLPAVIFAGHALDRFVGIAWQPHTPGALGRWPKVLVVIFVSYLGVNAVSTGLRTGTGVPRRSAAEYVQRVLDKGRLVSTPKEMLLLEWGLLRTLYITGPHPDLYAYLARIAYERKQLNRAEYFARRSLTLDAANQLALATARLIGVAKTTGQ
jgi:4-amino-4-deoxy-L-arabinose transferase-like glycosyltransferase